MMDFHILIVISCVFLASLFSLLFINKFFRRKTFEEIIAEKKALNEKILGQTKAAAKKPKKIQQLKKEMKREKKQRQKEQQKDSNTIEELEDSDAQSEQQSADDEPGLSKTHVEFEPEPEVINTVNTAAEIVRRASIAEKEHNTLNLKHKSKKEKKTGKASTGGILINKHEAVAVKENLVVEESLNNFEAKPPKDVVELKKQEREKKDDKQHSKKEKNTKKDKHVAAAVAITEKSAVIEQQPAIEVAHVTKEIKQQEEKTRQGSPKNQQNGSNSNSKGKQQNKKQNKETAATKELVLALDKLSENDTIGVSLLMNLFRRAELNRSEIQILIDYLLNRQQDMPASHSEWSDDICQKLKRQLEEKERLLAEEQEASIGIQAKLRELRTEINTERAQMNATIKAYIEKLQSKEQEISVLTQDMQKLSEKMNLEREKFQSKILMEKHAGSQDLLAQLQLMQNEIARKDKCIAELTCLVNASRQAVEESQQKNDIIQTQVQQIHALEQQREELEQISNNRIFELEKSKTLETENAESKVEIRNLQNALESARADLTQSLKDHDAVKSELTLARNVELSEKQNDIQALQAINDELTQQLAGVNNQTQEQSKEQSSLQATLNALNAQLAEKEQQLAKFHADNAELLKQLNTIESNAQQHVQQTEELQQLVDALKADVGSKQQQLQVVEQNAERFSNREKELLQQLQEQKEKNNDIRMKNWKLVEALQNAETIAIKQNKALSSTNASLVQKQQLSATVVSATTTTTISNKEENHVRELFQRLYPDAVKACAGTALSVSFEQWVKDVLATQVKLATTSTNTSTTSSSNKSTQSANSSSNHNSTHNSHNDNNLLSNNNNASSRVNNSDSTSTTSSSSSSSGDGGGCASGDNMEVQKWHTENDNLRARIDELTKLVTKTSNTLSDLEGHAREQDEYWRSVVSAKDEQISMLQHSNGGEQDI